MTDSDYFDKLRLGVLEEFAQQWVNDFKDVQISRIELRRYSTPRRIASHGGQATTLYAVVFITLEERWVSKEAINLLETTELAIDEIDTLPYLSNHGWRHMILLDITSRLEQEIHGLQVRGAVPLTPFGRLEAATKYLQTVPPRSYPELFGNDFKNVYETGAFPGDDYLREWTFIPIARDESCPLEIQTNTPPIVLYASHGKTGPASAKTPLVPNHVKPVDANVLILQYGSAAQRLYKSTVTGLKAQGKTITLSIPEERRAEAVKAFEENPDHFSPLTKKQIDLPGPYEDSESPPRKMVGSIIMLANIFDVPPNYQHLYNLFKKLQKNNHNSK